MHYIVAQVLRHVRRFVKQTDISRAGQNRTNNSTVLAHNLLLLRIGGGESSKVAAADAFTFVGFWRCFSSSIFRASRIAYSISERQQIVVCGPGGRRIWSEADNFPTTWSH